MYVFWFLFWVITFEIFIVGFDILLEILPVVTFLKNISMLGSGINSSLKLQSCKLYDNNYMIAWTQINTKICAFIAVLVLKLVSGEVLFINAKDNRNC